MNILIINGPNLNLLGTREPHLYGAQTLAGLSAELDEAAAALGVSLRHFQSNHEGAIVDAVQSARGQADWIVINAGAYTHTSVAIRDALAGVGIPFTEVHISNVYAREPFRRHSYLSDKASGVIAGLGTFGYHAALQFAVRQKKAARKTICGFQAAFVARRGFRWRLLAAWPVRRRRMLRAPGLLPFL